MISDLLKSGRMEIEVCGDELREIMEDPEVVVEEDWLYLKLLGLKYREERFPKGAESVGYDPGEARVRWDGWPTGDDEYIQTRRTLVKVKDIGKFWVVVRKEDEVARKEADEDD